MPVRQVHPNENEGETWSQAQMGQTIFGRGFAAGYLAIDLSVSSIDGTPMLAIGNPFEETNNSGSVHFDSILFS